MSSFRMRHQSFLIVFRLFDGLIFLTFQIFHPVDIVSGTHHNAAALVYECRPQEP
jgi:hypothetical protein